MVEGSEVVTMFEDSDEVVFHSLRPAAKLFGVSADTVRQWCLSGRLDGSQAGEGGPWTVRVPKDHPLLPENRTAPEVHHYPRVDDRSVARIAELEARVSSLESENAFLREQQGNWQRVLPELIERSILASRPPQPALPDPTARPWWARLWPFGRPPGTP